MGLNETWSLSCRLGWRREVGGPSPCWWGTRLACGQGGVWRRPPKQGLVSVCVHVCLCLCVGACDPGSGEQVLGGQFLPSLSQGSTAHWRWDSQGDPTAYLSTTKEPSGPMLLLFLLICSFFFLFFFLSLFEFQILFFKPKQTIVYFLPAPLGLSLGLQTECNWGSCPSPLSSPALMGAVGHISEPTFSGPRSPFCLKASLVPSPIGAASGVLAFPIVSEEYSLSRGTCFLLRETPTYRLWDC